MKLNVSILKLIVSTMKLIVSTMIVSTMKLIVKATGRNGLGLVSGRSAATDEASTHGESGNYQRAIKDMV